jgi:hypothetical protein
MDKPSQGENKPEETKDLVDGMRSTRQSLEKVEDKSRLLKEQLNKLEQKLWGRKPDETVGA